MINFHQPGVKGEGVGVTHKDLVEEVLNELFFQRSGGEESMEVGSQKFRDKVSAASSQPKLCRPSKPRSTAYMSSRGEIKISLKLMICRLVNGRTQRTDFTCDRSD